ncbi:hypothetical protein J4764_03860 [Burkholderia pseudomallei]|uniref:hypothetical protein n=1 Tax=Burkholderia pseudomallei TaxID=28450 RepID=UPI00111DE899|nr:hypothetical protein [Burkholderia pseudomallei]MBO2966572.1 hypothetical protein [Burkholderia pseudomallei]MBO3035779.1 hypothetical protein [Burkholderia pseudomallei]MBO7766746.1 hypothetical protein [Burkholderia pseudomallei]MCT7348365.1 hypothetical protein [Burkholderia pseudomallei]MCT7916811.1 hypothetical protein [Burkholderia pseudomallei]
MAVSEPWSTAELDPKKIQLDLRNPRIEIEPNAKQAEIRAKLLKFEDVLDLARGIVRNEGLFYGERIITFVEGGKHVVLEGNRRVAACQMLLDPSLIPAEFVGRFPAAPPAVKATLRKLSADVAPNREAADPVLTKRHTERGAKPWSPVAKMRRAVRMLEHAPIDKVAEALGTTPGAIRKLVKPYRLLKYALDLDTWTDDERAVLENEKLVTNPYTRFFTLADTQRILQLSFDADQNPVSALPPRVFKEQMIAIARDFLLPDPEKGKPRCDTRTEPLKYFERFLESPEGKKHVKPAEPRQHPKGDGKDPKAPGQPAGGPNAGAPRPKTQKISIFFEKLECHVTDDNLLALTREIRGINHKITPISASLVLRALFECALVYQIKKAKKWNELLKLEKQLGRDPALISMINFCSNFNNGVFSENKICRVLSAGTTKQAKDYLDSMTHLKYQQADAPTLETIANNIRGVIQYILEGN